METKDTCKKMAFLMKLCTRRVLSRFAEPVCQSLRLSTSSSVLMCPGSLNDVEIAKSRVATLSNDPGNEAKLRLYGLFKQVSYTIDDLLLVLSSSSYMQPM